MGGVFIAEAMTPETKDKVKHEELERVLRAIAKEIRAIKLEVKELKELINRKQDKK